MPIARYTAEGGTYRVGGVSFEPNDGREVDADLAEYLKDVEEFEVKRETDESNEADEMGYEERTALAEGLANESWQHAVATVEAGDADEYLDELEQADDRDSVQEAIEQRRDELEREG